MSSATTLLKVAATAALSLTLPAQNVWTSVATTNSPSKGLWPGMAFATVTGKSYLYGGAGGGTTVATGGCGGTTPTTEPTTGAEGFTTATGGGGDGGGTGARS